MNSGGEDLLKQFNRGIDYAQNTFDIADGVTSFAPTLFFKSIVIDVDLNEMASNTEGYVGADLAALVREAAILALRDDNKATKVTSNHFYKALDLVPPSINEDTIKYYSELHSNLAKRVNKGKKRSEDDLYA